MEFVGSWAFMALLLVAGPPVNDLASVLEPGAYLKAHDVEPKAERLAELAVREPRDGKEQMIQLMAIRWLGLHPAETKKADAAMKALLAVGGGEKGQDANGFARMHAMIAVARIDGHPISVAVKLPRPDRMLSEALAWFPAEATIFGTQNLLSAGGEVSSLDREAVSALLARIVPEREWRPLYDFADAVGNLRLDRIGFALEMEEKGSEPKRIWLRFTGAGDPKLLEAFIAKFYPERQERKGADGKPIVILSKKGRAPGFALVGKTDLLIAGTKNEADNHVEVLEAMLDARADKIKNVTAGSFAEVLKSVQDNAQGLLVADLPEGLREELGRSLPLKAIPRRVVVQTTRGKGLAARLEATMKDADEAAATVKSLQEWKEQGLRALKEPPPGVKVPKKLIEIGRQALEGVKIEAKGAAVTLTGQMPAEALKEVVGAVEEFFRTEFKEP